VIPPLRLFPRVVVIRQRNTLPVNIRTSTAFRTFLFVGISADITGIIRRYQTTEIRSTYSALLSTCFGLWEARVAWPFIVGPHRQKC